MSFFCWCGWYPRWCDYGFIAAYVVRRAVFSLRRARAVACWVIYPAVPRACAVLLSRWKGYRLRTCLLCAGAVALLASLGEDDHLISARRMGIPLPSRACHCLRYTPRAAAVHHSACAGGQAFDVATRLWRFGSGPLARTCHPFYLLNLPFYRLGRCLGSLPSLLHTWPPTFCNTSPPAFPAVIPYMTPRCGLTWCGYSILLRWRLTCCAAFFARLVLAHRDGSFPVVPACLSAPLALNDISVVDTGYANLLRDLRGWANPLFGLPCYALPAHHHALCLPLRALLPLPIPVLQRLRAQHKRPRCFLVGLGRRFLFACAARGRTHRWRGCGHCAFCYLPRGFLPAAVFRTVARDGGCVGGCI